MHYFKHLAVLGLALGFIASRPAQAQVSVGVGIGPVYTTSGYDDYGYDDDRSYDNSDYDDYDSQDYGYSYAAPVCPYGYSSYYPSTCAPYGSNGPDCFIVGVFIGAGIW